MQLTERKEDCETKTSRCIQTTLAVWIALSGMIIFLGYFAMIRSKDHHVEIDDDCYGGSNLTLGCICDPYYAKPLGSYACTYLRKDKRLAVLLQTFYGPLGAGLFYGGTECWPPKVTEWVTAGIFTLLICILTALTLFSALHSSRTNCRAFGENFLSVWVCIGLSVAVPLTLVILWFTYLGILVHAPQDACGFDWRT